MQSKLAITFGILLTLTGCAKQDAEVEASDEPARSASLARAEVSDRNGIAVGTVEITQSDGVYSVEADLEALPPGISGFHLHAVGACEGPDFSSAGGHLNPNGNEHGANNPQGKHLGDLPNLVIDQDGKATATIEFTSSEQDFLSAIFDEDGTAVVIHEDADDYVSDPSGNAGSRIACGVFFRND